MKGTIPSTHASPGSGEIVYRFDRGLGRSAASSAKVRTSQGAGTPRAERLVRPGVGRRHIESGEYLADGIIGFQAFLGHIFERLWRRSSAGTRTNL